MRLVRTLQFILSHPLNQRRPLSALWRYFWWQARSRLSPTVTFDWIGGAKLVASRGMTGATGNIYCGLHEFQEMAFLLHVLRPGDLFLDIGANIGSFTVLASKVCGAKSVAFEPDPGTAGALRRNIAANGIQGLARVEQVALGDANGELTFTVGQDTTNRAASPGAQNTQIVPLCRVDDILADAAPVLIKMDVEGFEDRVFKGAVRTLSSPSLLAIQTEMADEEIDQLLATFGFKPAYYEPFSRTLSDQPLGRRIANMLYVREREKLLERLASAPRRKVNGADI